MFRNLTLFTGVVSKFPPDILDLPKNKKRIKKVYFKSAILSQDEALPSIIICNCDNERAI